MSEGTRDLPPRRGRPRDAGADIAILRAFFEVVAEAGYAGTTMDAVAERAGVAKTTIYRRWATKEELMVAAHGLFFQENPIPDTGTLRGDLTAGVRIVIENLGRWPMNRVLAATIGEMAHNEEVARLFREAVLEQRFAAVANVFDRAVRRGEISATLDWRMYTHMLIGPLLLRITVTAEPVDMQVGLELVEAVLRAVGAETAKPATA